MMLILTTMNKSLERRVDVLDDYKDDHFPIVQWLVRESRADVAFVVVVVVVVMLRIVMMIILMMLT
jgi:hypothetical protein